MICFVTRPHPKDGEGNIFTGVCPFTSTGGGGVHPSQVGGGGGWFTPLPCVRTGWGYPTGWDWMGVPPIRPGWGTLSPSGLDGIPPRNGWGYPLPIGRSGDRAATQRAVCLLHSCSRTFLLIYI